MGAVPTLTTKRAKRRRKWSAAYYAEHPEKWQERYALDAERRRKAAKDRRLKLRKETLAAYGNKCKCCGEKRWEFLSIDHMKNDGAEHRRQIGAKRPEDVFRWLKKNNWPKGFRVLCFNCNLSRGHWGYCPHEREHG